MNRLHVLIPTYNCGDYIGMALRSIFSQQCVDIRVTVVDNLSTDHTADLVKSEFSGSVEYIRNSENIGGIRNHNRCMELAEGKYVKLLSADDILLPGVLEEQMRIFDENSSAGIVTCDCDVINNVGESIGTAKYLNGVYAGKDAIRACTKKVSNFIGGPSNTMLRADAIGDLRWDPAFAWTADLMFYCAMLENSDLVGTGNVGVAYRRRTGSISEISCPLRVRRISDLEFLKRFSTNPLAYARWGVRYAKASLK